MVTSIQSFDFSISPSEIENRLCTHLLNTKLVSKEQLSIACKLALAQRVPLQNALINSGVLGERQFLEAIAEITGILCDFDLQSAVPDPQTVEFLTPDYLRENNLIPLMQLDGRRGVITSQPLLFDQLAILEFSLEEKVTPILAERAVISRFLEDHLRPYQEIPTESSVSDEDLAALSTLANEAPVVRFIQDTIAQGIDLNASDVHFEANAKALNVRYRVNGKLTPPKPAHALNPAAILSRLKVLAELNISERRQPQDGRIQFRHANKSIDLRVSTVPTQHGESAVLRILDQSQLKLNWKTLGFDEGTIAQIRKLISLPNGIILITGPTGSGKTTTLYTALSELNTSDKKLFTVEDPIEYDLPGITQIQVNSKIGFGFGTALRSILRQDPNIIMIGEIRDAETAEIACRAALVGRLVFATLHTNSAKHAIPRLLDLGVPEYLITATLKAVLGQSLENVECDGCQGKGCVECNGSGSGARRLNYEVFLPNEDLAKQG